MELIGQTNLIWYHISKFCTIFKAIKKVSKSNLSIFLYCLVVSNVTQILELTMAYRLDNRR